MRRGGSTNARVNNACKNKKIEGGALNKTLSDYIKSCDMETLLNLFEDIVSEINRRKENERESSGGAINAYLQGNKLEERQSLYRRNAPVLDTS